MRFRAIKIDLRPTLALALLAAALICAPLLIRGRASAAMTGGVAVPVLMYHSVLDGEGRVGDYAVTAETFRADMLWLKENGYTSVFVSELVDFVMRGVPLPPRPVVITLDDGYLNNLLYALPVLEELDMKAVISVIGRYSVEFSETPDRSPSYAHLTWDDITALAQSGLIEIGYHTYDLHELSPRHGCMKKSGESTEEYRTALSEDISRLQALLVEKCGVEPAIFAYPYGRVSKEALPVLKSLGFRAALTCESRVNYLTGEPDELFQLGRFNRPSGISTETFMKRLSE
mgnify:CR=1 FL=1